VAFVDPGTRNLWLYEKATQALTNVSALPGFPGSSGAHSLNTAFDLGADEVEALLAAVQPRAD